MSESAANMTPYDAAHDDQKKIMDDGVWVPCRICEKIFLRIRLTRRYCNTCKRAFCEGEHGGFSGRGPAVWVQCHRPRKAVRAITCFDTIRDAVQSGKHSGKVGDAPREWAWERITMKETEHDESIDVLPVLDLEGEDTKG